MDTRLTLKLDRDVIEKAKRFAQYRGISLSRLVESYFLGLTCAEEPASRKLTGVIAELAGILAGKGGRRLEGRLCRVPGPQVLMSCASSSTRRHSGLQPFGAEPYTSNRLRGPPSLLSHGERDRAKLAYALLESLDTFSADTEEPQIPYF
jgi:hypothetical protein